MKLRYQMRGLGIGMVVTALLMGVATKEGLPLSDAEIRAKALELGMVESDSLRLSDLGTDAKDRQPEQGDEGSGMAPEGTAEPVDGGEPESMAESGAGGSDGDGEGASGSGAGAGGSEADGEGASGSGAGAEGASGSGAGGSGTDGEGASGSGAGTGGSGVDVEGSQGTGGQDGTVTFVIEPGATSSSVCRQLEEAGLVEDFSVIDTYLCSNGYSTKIRAGTFEIAPGMSVEELVKIITKEK